MYGYNGGVLWGTLIEGVFYFTPSQHRTSHRVYPNELTELGAVPTGDWRTGRWSYDQVALDALVLAGKDRLFSGLVCIAGRANPKIIDPRMEKLSDELSQRPLLPYDDEGFKILYWDPKRKHPFVDGVLKGLYGRTPIEVLDFSKPVLFEKA